MLEEKLCPRCPAIAFIDLHARLLDVAQLLLHLCHLGTVTCILPHIVTQLHSRTTVRGRDLNDNVEGLGLFSVGLVIVVIW